MISAPAALTVHTNIAMLNNRERFIFEGLIVDCVQIYNPHLETKVGMIYCNRCVDTLLSGAITGTRNYHEPCTVDVNL